MTERTPNPFPGPRPFTFEERNLFFSRDEEIADINDLLCSYPLVLLYSQSGSGKSSLLQAGLRPVLETEFGSFEILRLVRDPIRSTTGSENNVFVQAVLRNYDLSPHVNTLADLFVGEVPPKRRVIVLDQFEETFSYFPDRWEDRKAFLAQITLALELNADLRILLVLREEYLGQLASYADLLPLNLQIRYRLERLKADAAIEAIQKPFAVAGMSIERELAERIVSDLSLIRARRDGQVREARGEFIEPVHLQVVCRDLWDRRVSSSADDAITTNPLETVDLALQRFYERGIKEAATKTGVRESKIRRWFDESLITSAGTRRVLFRDERRTDGLENDVVDILEQSNLVRTEPRASEQTSELTHDRLIGPVRHSNADFRTRKKMLLIPAQALGAIVLLALAVWGLKWSLQQRHQTNISKRFVLESNEARAEHLIARRFSSSQEGGDRAVARAHYEAALKHYLEADNLRRSLLTRTNDYESMSALVDISEQRGPYRKRVLSLLEESRTEPTWDEISRARVTVALANLYFEEGRTRDSEMLLGELTLNSLPSDDRGHADEVLGRVLYRRGELDDADAHFKRALAETRSSDAQMRYTLMLDKALVAIARGKQSVHSKAIPILTSLQLGRVFRKEKDQEVGDPPKLLSILALAEVLDGEIKLAKRDAFNNVALTTTDEYDHALALTTLAQVLMAQNGEIATNHVLDLLRQADGDLNKISAPGEPYDPVLSAVILLWKGRVHALQVRLRRADSVFPECAGRERDCANEEISRATQELGDAQDQADLALL